MLRKTKEKANISKDVNPHAFRHARATHLAKHLPEAIMKEHFGWTQSSKMASIYNHLSGKDVDEALLKVHGLKPQENEKLKNISVKVCSNCNENNSVLSHFCKKCNLPLDLKIAFEMQKRIELEDEKILKILKELIRKFPKVKPFLIKKSKELEF